jgi:hypothetical protein
MKFPPGLDNIERKFLHHLADQLGLVSKSRGKDEKRYITVYKRTAKGPPPEEDDNARFPLLEVRERLQARTTAWRRLMRSGATSQISPESSTMLAAHVSKFRITDGERETLIRDTASEATHVLHRTESWEARRAMRRPSSDVSWRPS